MTKIIGCCLFLSLVACSASDDSSIQADNLILIADNSRKTFTVETSHYFDENDLYVNDYTCINVSAPSEKIKFVINPQELGENAIYEFIYYTGTPGISTVYFPNDDFASNVTQDADGFLSGTFSGHVHNWDGDDKLINGQFKLTE
jgi:hypothetical protein